MLQRVEIFHSQTLPSFEPQTKKPGKKDNDDDDAEDITFDLETNMWIDNFILPDVLVQNTRAGLYIYINAMVSLLR